VEKGGKLLNLENQSAATSKHATKQISAAREKPAPVKKLSYKEQRELEALPGIIEQLETRQATLASEVSTPGFYQQDDAIILDVLARLAGVETDLETAYKRWEELDSS
jgi:ATP-binding cassette subfamily F protein uup